MNTAELESRLRAIAQRLLADMGRTETEARALAGPYAQTRADTAENKETVFEETTSAWNHYTQVRDALQRIEEGTYGKCTDCGRPIEARRLDSVPWTPYCLHHRQMHDRESAT